MHRTLAAATSLLLLVAPRIARAGDVGSTLVSIVVPGMIFLFVLAIVGGAFYVGYRETKEKQETLRLAIEKGLPISPELVEGAGGERNPDKDLRAGIRQIFIGLGIGVLLWFVAPFKNVWAIGAMIAIFGLGNLVAWMIGRRRDAPRTPAA
jgi:hypothetical protein